MILAPRVPHATAVLISAFAVGLLAGGAAAAPAGERCPSRAACGSVMVPIDRAQPARGSFRIAYELYRHRRRSTPSAGTIVPLGGGPGSSNTGAIADWRFEFGSLLDRFDLLVIDNRGTGRSGAIDCKGVQHRGVTRAHVEACARKLGWRRDFYRSASVAEDIKAVRAALGIDRIDLYGFSAGAMQARAYAVRHGDRLRSLVLDSAALELDFVRWQSEGHHTFERQLGLVCRRSVICRTLEQKPRRRIARLAAALRQRPVVGTSYDASGRRVRLSVDETLLANTYFSNTLAEALAAARALARGDRRPLLRFVAENRFLSSSGDSGDPADFSLGDLLAVGCNELLFPWSWASSIARRKTERAAAFAALPEGTFGPFSGEAVRDNPGIDESGCIFWPAPASQEAPVPDGAPHPDVPTLLLSGDLDGSHSVARAYARRFPNATFIAPANVFHGAAFESACARLLVRRFITRLDAGNTVCARRGKPLFGYSAFPRRVRDVDTPVRRRADDASTQRDRKAIAAAVETLVDLSLHGFSGHGLRGGVCREMGDHTLVLERCRFVADLAVSGRATYRPATRLMSGRVTVRGGGTDAGALRMRPARRAMAVVVGGTIGRRPVHVIVPVRN
jgi:pimeloyl-ACP methyl ester carboxylesterase